MEENKLKELKRRFENLDMTFKKKRKKTALNWDKCEKELEE